MDLLYRRSEQEDIWRIQRLVLECFGDRSNNDVLRNAESGRYLLALDGNKVVAMTGISAPEHFGVNYVGHEVDWTCIDKEYRSRGIITKMIAKELNRVGVYEDVYCSCWAWGPDAQINLHAAMKVNGFKLIIPNRITYDSDHYRFCQKYCVHYHEGCKCREDLYLRQGCNSKWNINK